MYLKSLQATALIHTMKFSVEKSSYETWEKDTCEHLECNLYGLSELLENVEEMLKMFAMCDDTLHHLNPLIDLRNCWNDTIAHFFLMVEFK